MLRTQDGKEYIDGLSVSALWNVNIGHGRKELARAAAAQMEKLAYASAYAGFSNEPAIRLAERIVGLAYSNMAGAYFTTGGAESNESAFKFARYYWKRMGKPDKVKIISRSYGYHGVTMAAMSATSLPGYQKMFGPMVPNFHQVVPPYPYRWPGNGDAGIGAADAVEESILAHGADTVAAIICEPVMGAGGVIVPPPTYFPGLREICDRHGVLLIADEVITGFGRTGKWFALTHWGVEPDLMSFAKGVTSGYLPLGGVLVSKRIHAAIEDAPMDEKFMHAATYSGHPQTRPRDGRAGGGGGREAGPDHAPARRGRRAAAEPGYAVPGPAADDAGGHSGPDRANRWRIRRRGGLNPRQDAQSDSSWGSANGRTPRDVSPRTRRCLSLGTAFLVSTPP